MELNVTYIILDGYVEMEKYRALYFVVFCSAFVVIICSNSTIVCLIWIHKNLHEPMYFFIAALLLNSVIFSTAVYPKILVDVLSKKQVVTYSMCLFQWYIIYAIAGSEFWLLMAMAYDRYLAICKPLQYPTIMTRSRVNVLLAVAWTVPALQLTTILVKLSSRKVCNFTFRGFFCNSTLFKLHCVQATDVKKMALLGSITLVIIPVLFNCFTYIHIFRIAKTTGLEMRKKALRTCLPHLVVLLNYFCLTISEVSLGRMEGEIPKLGHFILGLQVILYHPIFNPFVYGLQMKKISTHLKRLFCATKTLT